MKSILTLLVAVIIAAGSAGCRPETRPPEARLPELYRPVLVASQDIAIADTINGDMVHLELKHISEIPDDALESLDGVSGKAPKQRVYDGEVIRGSVVVEFDSLLQKSTGYRIVQIAFHGVATENTATHESHATTAEQIGESASP